MFLSVHTPKTNRSLEGAHHDVCGRLAGREFQVLPHALRARGGSIGGEVVLDRSGDGSEPEAPGDVFGQHERNGAGVAVEFQGAFIGEIAAVPDVAGD